MSLESNTIRIGIDLMGAEIPPEEYVKTLTQTFRDSDLELFLIASEKVFKTFSDIPSLNYVYSEEVIEMEDDPLFAIRRKKKSSMHVGLEMLKNKEIDAFISLGNTGALVALSILSLSTLSGISRPALLALLPTHKKPLAVLDLGAHIDCKPENFLDFAILANGYQKIMGIPTPRIGLLNIGSEKIKGTKHIKKVYNYLYEKKDLFNFVGNIEPKEIFKGDVDVIVTDGFTGNILLKTSEGIASLVLDELGQNENVISKSFFQDLKKRLHYAQYPGALLIGLNSLVVKCHGYSSPQALINGIMGVKEMVASNFIEKLKNHL